MNQPSRPATLWRMLTMLVSAQLTIACSAIPTGIPTVVPATSGTTPTGTAAATSAFPRGGTLRVVVPANDEVNALRTRDAVSMDPQRSLEFVLTAFVRLRFRTLVNYNGLSIEEGGARLHPDLAEALPQVSPDGLTWTIRVKRGIHYGPPLEETDITARDFVRAFHRLHSPEVDAGLDFADIEGATEYTKGTAASISGLEAPDDHTLVVRLTGPAGDFGNRLAEWFVVPLPPDPLRPAAPVTSGTADDSMWRYFAASGPYMFEGSETIDLSVPPEERRLPSGLAADGRIILVRNPSWDPSADALRPAYPDRIEIELVESEEAAVARLDAGTADLLWNAKTPPSITPAVFASFQNDPARGRAYVNEYGGMRGLIINVAVPPLDDIHVRRAMNWVIDKSNLVNIEGGPVAARVAGHLAPDTALDGLLLDYDPFATAGNRGDFQKARAEMALSHYDSDGDGRCDAPACEHVEAITRTAFASLADAAAGDFRKLGLGVEVTILDDDAFYGSWGEAAARHELWLGLGFYCAYIGAACWLTAFDGRIAIGEDSGNGTMVGARPEQLARWGYEVSEVPSVDDRIEACIPLIGVAQTQCWAAVDQYLMEEVVPWVPYSQDRFAYLTGPRVVHVGFDELTAHVAFDQFALSR